eukprot:m.51850 g.51850  ORF g.51850 m.51850 type:complete len:217 (-) comp9073_c0_seq2:4899-5549(-)
MMRNLYNRIQKASQAVHGPESAPVKVGSYSGISFDDPSLVGIRENLMSHWYNPAQGIEKFLGMLSLSHVHPCTWCFNGMNAGGPYLPRQVFENFNNYFFINKESQKDINPPVGGRPVVLNSSFMSQYWVPGREAQTFGAIKSTREIGVTTKGMDEIWPMFASAPVRSLSTPGRTAPIHTPLRARAVGPIFGRERVQQNHNFNRVAGVELDMRPCRQ